MDNIEQRVEIVEERTENNDWKRIKGKRKHIKENKEKSVGLVLDVNIVIPSVLATVLNV